MSMREQRLVKQRVVVSRNDHIPAFSEVSLTFWDSMNFFSVRFAILLTLCHTYCCTWLTVTKALATPTNSNAHVSPVGSKVMRCTQGIHCGYVYLVLHSGGVATLPKNTLPYIFLHLQTNVKMMQGWGFVKLPSLWYHPYLVCILFGMPSPHPFTFLMFLSLC